MGKILVLDELTANQIAAGEVVERPASVVKELVENAVDAGSTRIDVWIEEGGLERIRVTDNGSGIDAEDCETAFFRHATSKIGHARDLFQIRTLGFRGEALPSIAAVSRVECVTSSREDGLGKRIAIEGGKVIALEDAASDRGTDMTVRSLFYNTPARLKYMKTIQTELGHISDYLNRMALGRPDIAFTLNHNGSELLRTSGNGDLLQVIAGIYGVAAAKAMLPVQAEDADYRVSGFIAKPELSRSNRNGISLIVNGRYIRHYGVVNALLAGYHTLLPIHRFPLAVLKLDMDASLVDVNVHPSKWEVRFSKEAELTQLVRQAVEGVLKKQTLIPQASTPKPKQPVVQEQLQWSKPPEPPATVPDFAKPSPPLRPDAPKPQDGGAARTNSFASESAVDRSRQASLGSAEWKKAKADDAYQSDAKAIESPQVREALRQWTEAESRAPKPDKPRFPELHPVGQVHGTYIVAQNDEGLYLIDQHAAHERIHYEYYFEKFGNPEPVSQELLIPMTLELTAVEAQELQAKLPLLAQIGVVLEPFGNRAFRLVSHPFWFPRGEEAELVEEMVQWVLAEKKAVQLRELREKSAVMVSCKASIKANQSQTLSEMSALLERLAACSNPFTCPHGRPIVVSFSTYELEKMFKRVM